MKKILFIIALFCGLVASSQIVNVPGYTTINSRYQDLGRLFNEIGLPAGGNATFKPGQAQRAGSVYYDSTGSDAGLYIYNGSSWVLQGTPSAVNLPNELLCDCGNVVYSGTGLKFYITPSVYRIDGIIYGTDQDSVTLSASDPDDPRKDVIYLATTGVEVLTGTPAGPAAEPQLDADQIKLTVVDVPALATTPGITQQILYDDHTGESNISVTNVGGGTAITADPDNTTNLFRGTKSLNVSNLTPGDAVYIEHPTLAWDLTDKNAVQGFIKLKAVLPSLSNYRLRLENGSTSIGNEVTLVLNKSSLEWQPISIPVDAFGDPQTNAFTRVRIRYTSNVGNHLGFYQDYTYLQEGIVQPGPAGAVNSVNVNIGSWPKTGPTTGDVVQTFTGPGPRSEVMRGDLTSERDSSVKYIGTINSLTKSANGATINTLTNEIVMQEADADDNGVLSEYDWRRFDTTANLSVENLDNTVDTLLTSITPLRSGIMGIKDSTGIGIHNNGRYLAFYSTGGAGSQDLQSVTDIGNSTTNSVISNSLFSVFSTLKSTNVANLVLNSNGVDAGGDLQLKSFYNDSTVTLRTLDNITDNRTIWLPDESDTLATRGFARSVGGGGGGSGTVTNVATGYGLSGGPITTTGTLVADTTSADGLVSKDRLAATIDLIDTSNILIESTETGEKTFYIRGDTTLVLKDPKNTYGLAWSTDTDSSLLATIDSNLFVTQERLIEYGDSLATAITGGSGDIFTINILAGTYTSPANNATVYFFSKNAAPNTSTTTYEQVMLRAATIKGAVIDFNASTPGTAEGWSLYIRNNTTATDYLIETETSSTNRRTFINASLNIPVAANDAIIMKLVNPVTWATAPATVLISGYIELEL